MMKKSSSNKSIFKLVFLFPVLLISVYLISCSKDDSIKDDAERANVVLTTKDGETVELKNTENANDYDVENIEKVEVFKNSEGNTGSINTGQENGEVFLIVEEMPKFEGEEVALRQFIADNVKYPEEAKKKGESGKVYVRFVVNKEGAVEQVSIARGVSPSLNAEAIRVVQSIPAKWTPGKQKGEPVAVYFTVPINFRLN
ncbi:MAG: energy transducer TonB [Chloroflexia bacterium]|nr:energy transducer TonB [Chloroflexia bacterium]